MALPPSEIIALAVIFSSLPLIVVSLLMWSRRIMNAQYTIDDCFTVFALTFCVTSGITLLIGAMTTLAPTNDDFSIVAKITYANQLLSHLSIGFTKTSILFLYRRFFHSTTIKRITNALLFIVGLWTISFLIAIAFRYSPIYAIRTMKATERASLCKSVVILGRAYTASDLLINIMILILPLSLISGLLNGLPSKQKYAVGGMFALGAFACVTSLARIILSFQFKQGTDMTFESSPFAASSLIEASLGVVVACLPNLAPMLTSSTPSGSTTGYTISSPITSSKVTPRISGLVHLTSPLKTDIKDPFDDHNALIISKPPRVSLKELEAGIHVENTRPKMHERNDSSLTCSSAKSGRSLDRGYGPPLMTEIKRKAVPQSNESTPQGKELPKLPRTWNGTVDDDNGIVEKARDREGSIV